MTTDDFEQNVLSIVTQFAFIRRAVTLDKVVTLAHFLAEVQQILQAEDIL